MRSGTAPLGDQREWAERVREEARYQWGSDPAGAMAAGDEPVGTPESFARIEAHRYREQPWMHDVFEFWRFRGKQVLEVGVGLGTDHLQFARAGGQMTGIDLTPRCIELTHTRFQQEGLVSDLDVMDAEQLAFPNDSFDAVFSFGVLHHIPDPRRAFREIRRVLRPGGVFIGGLYSRESAFYGMVRAERLATGGFLRESLDERLSRVEYSTTNAKPLVRLFRREELRGLLHEAGFEHAAIKRRHAGLGSLERRLPRRAVETVSRRAGWYLVHQAR